MIDGRTTLIAHIGYPTETFKAPMIYNPYFEQAGIDAVVVPMGVKSEEKVTKFKNDRRTLLKAGAAPTAAVHSRLGAGAVHAAGFCSGVLGQGHPRR